MLKILSAFCLSLAIAPAGWAQTELVQAFASARLALKAAPQSQSSQAPDRRAAALAVLSQARAAMTAEGDAGLRLIDTLDRLGAVVDVDPGQAELAVLTTRGSGAASKPAIVFSPAIAGASARYAALLLAEKTAELRWSFLPACAEKDFIVSALMARAWLEVGGRLSALPLFDGLRDEARSARIKSWLAQDLRDYGLAQAARGLPTFRGLLDKNLNEKARLEQDISDSQRNFDNSNGCESYEQGLLRQIDEDKAALAKLRAQRETLESQRDQTRSFSKEEALWRGRQWRRFAARQP